MSKVFKNLFASLLGQIVTVLLGLIIPRLILTSFGSDINGLLNSTSQMFAYIALLEAGVGTATLQALYAPVAKMDHLGINRILSATNRFYRRTGIIYFFCIVLLAFGYPLIIKSGIPNFTVVLVILLQGMTGVINYLFQGKFRILLQAEGKNYVLTNLATVVQICVGFGKVVVISLGFDIVAVQTVYFLINIAQMLFICFYIRRNYRWIDLSVEPDYPAISQKNAVFVNQISSLVFNNTDTLLLSYFCNLKVVSVYSIYLMLCNMINTVVDNLSASITYKFGFLYSEDKGKFIVAQKIFERYYLCIVFWLYSVALVFLLPFIALYTKGVTDINYLDSKLPFLFVIMQLLSYSKRPFNQVVNMAQKFKETKWRSVAEATINLSVSLVAVPKYGIHGVIIGSIVALSYRLIDLVSFSNKLIDAGVKESVCNLLLDSLILVIVYFVAHRFWGPFNNYTQLFLAAAATTVVSGALFFSMNFALHKSDTKVLMGIIRNVKTTKSKKLK